MKSIQNVFTFTWNSRRSHFEDKENQRKKLNQTHIFTLSNLLIKLLILWKLNIYLCKKKNHNSREDTVSTSPFTWKVSRTSIIWHNFLTWVQADCSSTFLSFWTLLLLYWWGFSETEMHEREPGSEYNLTSVSIFSILFSMHFLSCWQGEFV